METRHLAFLNAEDPVAVRWARRVLGPAVGDVAAAMGLYGVGVCHHASNPEGSQAWLWIIWPLADEPFPSEIRSRGLSGYRTVGEAAEAVAAAYDSLTPSQKLFTLGRKHWGVRTAAEIKGGRCPETGRIT